MSILFKIKKSLSNELLSKEAKFVDSEFYQKEEAQIRFVFFLNILG
jgi:hypothetical protein